MSISANKQVEAKEKFFRYLKEKASDYTLIGDFKGMAKPVVIQHSCGEHYIISPHTFEQGYKRCPKCYPIKGHPAHNKHTKESFEKSLDQICGKHLFNVVEYEEWSKPVTFECCKCKHRFQKSATQFRIKPYCPNCTPRTPWNKLSTQEYLNRVKNKYGDQYSIESEYVIKSSLMHIRCNICGYSWYQRADTIMLATKCDHCYPNMSYGVKAIFDFFHRHQINFQREVSMPGMKLKLPLHFDFVLYNQNNDIICAIEYDGEQHYKAPNCWGGNDQLNITQQRDRTKNQYCQEKQIKLYRILWKDYDHLFDILTDILVTEKIWTEQQGKLIKKKERTFING